MQSRAAIIAAGQEAIVGENGTRETVRRLYDAYAARDFEQVTAALHDDID